MLRDIHLHGHLARHGSRVRLDVATPAEAVRALGALRPGFLADLRHGNYRIVRGALADGTDLGADTLNLSMGRCREMHIVPVPAVAGIEIGIIGWMLIGVAVAAVAMVAFMPTVKPPDASDRESDRASFIYDGAVNVTEQGHPVPLVFGRWRTGSVVVSSGVEITDIPYTGQWPTGNYSPGFSAGGAALGAFLGLNLVLPWPPEQPVTPVGGKGGKGGGQARAAQEDPNTLQSQATARIVELLSEGEIGGLVDGLKSVYFDDTPVQNDDDSFNFKGVAIEERVGLPEQDAIEGHTDQSNTREVDRVISTAIGPATETISDPDVNRARVVLSLNGLYKQDTENGDMKTTSLDVKIELQSNGGGFTTIVEHQFNGKTTSTYQKAFDITLPAGGAPWDIRVTRVTPDREAANYVDDLNWDLMVEITDSKLEYPDSAVIGLTVDVKQFGSNIPVRSYDIYGLIVDVPTNFDPITRVYATEGEGTSDGMWDGTFKRAWTDEPVWCWRELCVNKRWGLGRRIGLNQVDKWALYAIAQRNNGDVPNGMGGMEPRHTFNGVINTREQAYKVLTSLAASFRSVVYWASGLVSLAQDSPADPEQLVVPANTMDGEVQYETTDIEEQASAYIVAYNEPDEGYRLAYEVVEDPDLRARIGWKTKDVVAYGEVRRAGAVRFGRWLLEDQRSASDRANWTAGYDQAQITPNGVCAIQDPELSGKSWGGRVRSSNATGMQLDRPVTIESGRVYTLKVTMRDGTIAERVLTNAPGTVSVVTWADALSPLPLRGAVWALQSDVLEPSQWRVRRRTEDAGGFILQAVSHDPDKYDRVELGLVLEPRVTSSIPTGALEVPAQLSIREFVKLYGDIGVPSVTFSWAAATDARVTNAQVQVRRPESNEYIPIPYKGGVSVDIENITEGEHGLRVRFADNLGRVSAWRELTETFDGLPATPSTPVGFYAYPGVDGVRFVWLPITSGHPIDYEIRRGATWESGQTICRVQGDTVTVKLPTSAAIDAQFWLKSKIRGADVYSEEAAYAATYQANVPNVNVVLTQDFQADSFAGGTLFRLAIADLDGSDALLLQTDTGTGLRYPHGDYRDVIDLGDTFYARCWLETTARNVTNETGPTWDELDTSWDSLGALTWSPADGPLDDVTIAPYIALDTMNSDVLEAWPLSADRDGIVQPTPVLYDILTGSSTSLHGNGTLIEAYSLVAWESVPFTETFTLSFNYTPATAPGADTVFCALTDGTSYLQLYYDGETDTIVLEDQDANQVSVPAFAFDTGDVYGITITQTATTRKVAWVSYNEATGEYGSGEFAPDTTFTDLYLGSAGSGNQETWEEADYTWDDIEATRTWEELMLVVSPAPGTYADMVLDSSTGVTSTNYVLNLLLRGPAGFGNYRPFQPGDYQFQQAWVWQRLSAPPSAAQNLYITESVVHVDVPDVFDGGTAAITTDAGGTTVAFNAAYHAAPNINAVVVGGTPATVEVVSVTATQMVVRLRDLTTPATLVAGSIHWQARGY